MLSLQEYIATQYQPDPIFQLKWEEKVTRKLAQYGYTKIVWEDEMKDDVSIARIVRVVTPEGRKEQAIYCEYTD